MAALHQCMATMQFGIMTASESAAKKDTTTPKPPSIAASTSRQTNANSSDVNSEGGSGLGTSNSQTAKTKSANHFEKSVILDSGYSTTGGITPIGQATGAGVDQANNDVLVMEHQVLITNDAVQIEKDPVKVSELSPNTSSSFYATPQLHSLTREASVDQQSFISAVATPSPTAFLNDFTKSRPKIQMIASPLASSRALHRNMSVPGQCQMYPGLHMSPSDPITVRYSAQPSKHPMPRSDSADFNRIRKPNSIPIHARTRPVDIVVRSTSPKELCVLKCGKQPVERVASDASYVTAVSNFSTSTYLTAQNASVKKRTQLINTPLPNTIHEASTPTDESQSGIEAQIEETLPSNSTVLCKDGSHRDSIDSLSKINIDNESDKISADKTSQRVRNSEEVTINVTAPPDEIKTANPHQPLESKHSWELDDDEDTALYCGFCCPIFGLADDFSISDNPDSSHSGKPARTRKKTMQRTARKTIKRIRQNAPTYRSIRQKSSSSKCHLKVANQAAKKSLFGGSQTSLASLDDRHKDDDGSDHDEDEDDDISLASHIPESRTGSGRKKSAAKMIAKKMSKVSIASKDKIIEPKTSAIPAGRRMLADIQHNWLSNRRRRKSRAERRAHKAFRTITIILGAFVIFWSPYFIFATIYGFCSECVPSAIFLTSYYMCYINSSINPFCYALANRQFKAVFTKMLKGNFGHHNQGRVVTMAKK